MGSPILKKGEIMKTNFMKTLALFFASVIAFMGTALPSMFNQPELSNPHATKEAKALYEYIVSLEGEAVLSGQQESTWIGGPDYEVDYIYNISGKYPAIRGFDYMNDDFDGVNQRASEWHKKGGIVTICWHCGYDFSGAWNECMNTEVPDWDKMLTEGTEEYTEMIVAMDKGARALRELKDLGIPVLWRPFHEFDGNWFWWSKGGSENFKKLWQIMYERYTKHWKLDNLIWVLGFSDQGEKSRSWYPGDNYCDIIGADTYMENMYEKLFIKMSWITNAPKPLCFHECGENPTLQELDALPWSWFMTWHSEYLTERNTPEKINELYNSEIVITLDEVDF